MMIPEKRYERHGNPRQHDDSRDAPFIPEVLQELAEKRLTLNRAGTDEDEQADYGNDAILLEMRRERFEPAGFRRRRPASGSVSGEAEAGLR